MWNYLFSMPDLGFPWRINVPGRKINIAEETGVEGRLVTELRNTKINKCSRGWKECSDTGTIVWKAPKEAE